MSHDFVCLISSASFCPENNYKINTSVAERILTKIDFHSNYYFLHVSYENWWVTSNSSNGWEEFPEARCVFNTWECQTTTVDSLVILIILLIWIIPWSHNCFFSTRRHWLKQWWYVCPLYAFVLLLVLLDIILGYSRCRL